MLLDVWKSVTCPVIGMLHVPALPGSPRSALSLAAIRDFVLRDAEALAAGGVHGLLLENFGDVPFFPGRAPAATVAQLTWLAIEVKRGCDLPLGVNVLRNDAQSSLAIAAAVGGSFIRVNVLAGARLTDQGIIEGPAHELLRERRRLNADHVKILADVDVKHSAPLAPRPLADEASELIERALADGLIVTGRGTGHAAAIDDLAEVKRAAGSVPVFVGSGVSAESVLTFCALADGFIVGTSLKVDLLVSNPIDPARVRRLMEAAGE